MLIMSRRETIVNKSVAFGSTNSFVWKRRHKVEKQTVNNEKRAKEFAELSENGQEFIIKLLRFDWK